MTARDEICRGDSSRKPEPTERDDEHAVLLQFWDKYHLFLNFGLQRVKILLDHFST